ncbi:hypothetical protein LEM8419_01903 [Neolewinella maritima]|uniref:Uncharacterized protein n=1 Tax=Neolewinella maritima TaxID=1383882 RepID=A0ABM9B0Z2_9BACT|nr:hypothetical protein [Neolewinella maritima]CAH1000825.1 hypothetical protein LEM8419_01903 [Neolewinella maritima]
MRTLLLLLLATTCALPGLLPAQTSRVEFGKNRVQYHRDFDEWEKYESDNFITYWYGNNQGVGQAVVQMAEYDFAYIQKMLESRMNEKVQLITYRDITDVKQSNIGAEEVFELRGNQSLNANTSYISGTEAKFLGNKAFVYFTGDHNDLRRQVREAMASVYIEQLLYGSSVQEVVQNAVLLNLPAWFKPGLVAYLGQDWNTELDDQLRDLMASGEYEDFNELAADYPRLAGHSFWYYIAENLGKPTVSNLLYLTRINRSVENGFLYVLGSNYETVLFNWLDFYRNRYNADSRGRRVPTEDVLSIKNKKQLPITQVKVSPDGKKIAYVLNEIGKYKVYLQDIDTGERELLLKGGQRNLLQATDYAYPLIDFSPTNQEVAIMYEHRDQPKLLLYDLNSGEKTVDILGIRLDRVLTMAYDSPNTFLISAMADGFSDIYTYYPASRQAARITNDFYDDLDAVPVNVMGRRGVVFASNRPDTSLLARKLDTLLPIGTYDLFYYDLEGKPGELVRITDTPLADEREPAPIDGDHFSYLSDANGIYNRYQAHLETYLDHYEQTIYLEDGTEIVLHGDSTLEKLDTALIDSIAIYPVIKERAVTEATTNYGTNILTLDASGKLPIGVESFLDNGTTYLRRFTFDTTATVDLAPTVYRQSSYRQAGQRVPQFTTTTTQPADRVMRPNLTNPEQATDQEGLLFQTRFTDPATVPSVPAEEEPTAVEDLLGVPATADTPPAPAAPDSTGTRPPLTIVGARIPERVRRAQQGNSGNGQARPAVRSERPAPELNRIYRFRPGRVTAYRNTFRVNYVKTTADNEPLFNGMNAFAANPDGYTRQPVGILFKGNIVDLMEDYVIEGGIRVPTTFNGTEYFLTASDVEHRLDKIYSVYRRNRREQQGIYPNSTILNQARIVEENTLMAQYGVRYPLDIFRSLRATATLRRDRVQTVATSEPALRSEPLSTERIGLRLEYVFDNTLPLSKNLLMGTRYKVYADVFKSFNISFDDEVGSQFEPGVLGIVGVDARHYERILRRSIIALRVAGATNFGKQKILYYLGGADNSIDPNNFNRSIPTPTTGDFVFQDLANPLRGFDVNIRNGATYALANAELRVPVFTYLFKNLRSAFLRDFQVVSFFDVGTAWTGSSPFDEDNPVNITEYPDQSADGYSPVRVRVRRFREPIVYGYGAGVRTTLFGYFLRADYGWGVETGNRQKGKIHVSLGLDF